MKNKFMCACIVFFPNETPKRWKYVTDLKSFAQVLSKDHPSWKYFNVYEKGTKQYLKRFYPGNSIPKTLGLLLLVLLTHIHLQKIPSISQPSIKGTTIALPTSFGLPLVGIYYTATISTTIGNKKEVVC
jgi:hypothetical protein